jgi:uncharacterized protein YjeT (DUF2065 family)
MQLDWNDFAAAFALYLVLEGLMPFLNPAGMKRVLATLAVMPDGTLRVVGLVSMLAGCALLHFVRA